MGEGKAASFSQGWRLCCEPRRYGSGRKRPRKPRILLRVHMTSLEGSRDPREPLFILRDLRAAKAINARSAKLNSRSTQWPLPLLQRVPMLASPPRVIAISFSLSIPFRRSLSIAVQTKKDFARPTTCIEQDIQWVRKDGCLRRYCSSCCL